MEKIEKLLKKKTKNIFGLKEIFSFLTIFALLFSNGLVMLPEAGAVADDGGNKIDICHATGSGSYNTINVDKNATAGGHDIHNNDIIPSYTYSSNEDTGQNCEIVTDEPAVDADIVTYEKTGDFSDSKVNIDFRPNDKISINPIGDYYITYVGLDVKSDGVSDYKDYTNTFAPDGYKNFDPNGDKINKAKVTVKKDSIPAVTHFECEYPGKNWDTDGQAILDNGCVVPTPDPICGNGIVETGEQCDNGAANTDDGTPIWTSGPGSLGYCSTTCQIYYVDNMYCGDGVINGDEQCDGCDLGDYTCETVNGFNGGILGCEENCTFDISGCTFDEPVITIVATKVVCDSEEDLPNWGAVREDGNPIDENTVSDFLSIKGDVCRIVPDWEFQWANNDVSKPDDNAGDAGSGWTTFGPTNLNGQAFAYLSEDDLTGTRIWFREVMKEGYIPFSGTTEPEHNNVSAEFYCHEDVLNYDNYDYIDNPETGDTYYCVGFNVPVVEEEPTGDLTICKYYDNGVLGQYEEGIDLPLQWNMDVLALSGLSEGSGWSTNTNSETGCVTLEGLYYGDYKVTEQSQEGWIKTYPVGDSQTVTLDSLSSSVYFLNYEEEEEEEQERGSITIYKYEDLNGNGEWDEGEPFLEGWYVFLSANFYQYEGPKTITDNEGKFFFNNLQLGEYNVCEFMEDGWENTEPGYEPFDWSNAGEGPMAVCYEGVVLTGEEKDIDIYFGNREEEEQEPSGTSSSTSWGGQPFMSTQPEGEVLGEAIELEPCGLYLLEYIKYGMYNNPFEVTKLQLFLNEYMGANLAVTGTYDLATKNAVDAFQLRYKDEVLRPWVEAGVHCDVNMPTSYVYKTTQRWINLLKCPTLLIPMPDLSGYEKANCSGLAEEVLGEEIVLEDGETEEAEPEEEEELLTEEGSTEDELLIETLETEEEGRGLPWLFILIIVLIAAGLIFVLYRSNAKK